VVLVLLVAFPAIALAAGDEGPRAHRVLSGPRIGLADAKPVGSVSLIQPAVDFRQELRAGARRVRAAREARLRRQRREAFATLPAGVSTATLEAIASCESGGDPTAVSSDGSYRGKYQFSFETWAAVGGSGDPAAASEAEQDYRAALLYAQSGSSPWPVCG
jgi:transglycosylase-like protein